MGSLTFYDKKVRPWMPKRLKQGAIVGHTTETSARIWVRAEKPGRYELVVSETAFAATWPEPLLLRRGAAWTLGDRRLHSRHPLDLGFDSDITGVVDVRRLRPGTRYYYGLLRPEQVAPDGARTDPAEWELGVERELSFRTPERNPQQWSFGLYSCHMPFTDDKGDSVDVSMWRVFDQELAFADASFVIGGGDQVYSDGHPKVSIWDYLKKKLDENPDLDDMVSWYRDIYRGYWGFEPLLDVYAGYPNYMTWDDHEIKDGWGSYTRKELADELNRFWRRDDRRKNLRLARQMFEAAKIVYGEYQDSHNPPAPRFRSGATSGDVWDYHFASCGADFYVLDMRGHRSFEREANRILGAPQHRRLSAWARGLGSRPGPVFVVAAVPVVHLRDIARDFADWLPILGIRDDVRDHWDHESNHVEVLRMLDTLFAAAERTERPLVFLSGDVHVGAVFRIRSERHPDARAFQVTSSGITYAMLSDRKRALLAAATKSRGRIGESADRPLPYEFERHHVYSQKNCCVVHVQTDGRRTQHIFVDLIGQAEDKKLSERLRLDLLTL
ncbi:MAG: alkaline phosphatase D family protein [Myxococcota bacterium]|nr:alkaline phosphatase D family protein [Myxococcota bacterium]